MMISNHNFLHNLSLFFDRDALAVLIQRSWQIVSGVGTILVVSLVLSPAEQGYYYLVLSLIGLQIFLELGMTTVLIQFISHAKAALNWTPDGLLSGDIAAKATIASVLRLSFIWYSIGGLVLGPILAYVGLFFVESKTSLPGFVFSWFFLVFTNLLLLIVSPLLSTYEGCGQIVSAARNRLMQDMVGNGAMWAAMVLGFGINAVCLLPLGKLLVMLIWSWKRRQTFRDILQTPHNACSFSWKREFAPFQFKIAVSWISGYFSNQIFTPIAFKAIGPLAAGQIGMSLSLSNAASVLAISWVTSRGPYFGVAIASHKFVELDRMFFSVLKKAVATYLFIAVSIEICALTINAFGLHAADRILPPQDLVLVLLSGAISTLVLAIAMYLRAHKKEPMLWLSVFGAIMMTAGMVAVAHWHPGKGSFAGIQLLINFIFLFPTIWLFFSLRKKWHM